VTTTRHVGEDHRALSELVLAELRRAIISGRLRPGERLVEARLAATLGVSRNPVREALRTLEGEGFVDLRPRRGARVTVPSRASADELFEVRGALEELAAGLAARRRTSPQMARLEDLVQRGAIAVQAGELADLPTLNTRFHAALCDAAANVQLTALIEPLRDRIQWLYAGRLQDRAERSWAEHGSLVRAVADRDEALSRLLAARHIENARAAFHAWAEG
jgi:DNA-binding GntR family transcriptional regulator